MPVFNAFRIAKFGLEEHRDIVLWYGAKHISIEPFTSDSQVQQTDE